ncbi:hypothetical protein Micbo1qcDRAFT_206971 [Microdochium bolleyi]|uniref:Ecp2 effector protein domain-containing protein n=1 Tax=Microdochium bolleyi TaxID=196109 RepID=A0A136IVB6_9PEZI|nr:hypothetical protein Micbo1qcDRAFT_206971 [Microdochium bolleyi]
MYAITAVVLSAALASALPTDTGSSASTAMAQGLPLNVTASAVTKVAARSDEWQVVCDTRPPGSLNPANDGVAYLAGLEGSPSIEPGPGNCQRISCSWGTAIFWCNESHDTVTVEDWGIISKSAQAVIDKCTLNGWAVAGEATDASGTWKTAISMGKNPCCAGDKTLLKKGSLRNLYIKVHFAGFLPGLDSLAGIREGDVREFPIDGKEEQSSNVVIARECELM